MLGSQFSKLLSKDLFADGLELLALARNNVDITSYKNLESEFRGFEPDVVLNCVAYTNVDDAEYTEEKKTAFDVNADGARNIATLCKKFDAKMIHFSTDYVFDGAKALPDGYDEDAACNPLNVYGESKLKGEQLIEKELYNYYIVRTSWLYGPRNEVRTGNFVDTMLKLGGEVLSGERDELGVVDDQFSSPTYTGDLAQAVIDEFLVPMGSGNSEQTPESGIYHLKNEGITSWHEFAVEIFRISEMEVPVKKISTAEFARPAKRPTNSLLLNTKLPKMRDWREALASYLYKSQD